MIAMLHGGGWDEVILLVVALAVGVGVVIRTGRKRPEDEEEEAAPSTEAEVGDHALQPVEPEGSIPEPSPASPRLESQS